MTSPPSPKLVFYDRGMFEARSFWQRLLSPPPPRAGLRPDFRSREKARRSIEAIALSPETLGNLLRITRDNEVLTQAVLAAAAAVVLSRYNDVAALAVGCPAGDETGQPLFPIVLTLDRAQSFKALLLQTRQSILDARTHRDFPWRRLLSDDETTTVAAPWSIAVSCSNADTADVDESDATIVADTTGAERRLRIVYDGRRFAASTIAQFGHHLATFLAGALAGVDREIGKIVLMDAQEKARTLIEWNWTAKPLPTDFTFNSLFKQQVLDHPAAAALSDGAKTWNYAEVDKAAERMAGHLRAKGCGPGDIVGICLPASALRIIALLAVLRAGAAFLPLDADYPSERLAFMVGNAKIRVLLTTSELEPKFAEAGVAGIAVDPARLIGEEIDQSIPGRTAGPGDPAYVIYTSGSTGQPKGVVIGHRGLVNLILEQIRLFKVMSGSRVLQFASFSFDAAVSEIGMALCAGAALHVATREDMIPGAPLATLLRDRDITHVTLPPSSLSAMPDEALPNLRTLIVAGEVCPAGLVDRWAPGRLFINGYGPTECTIGVTFAACEPDVARLSIGHLIANTRAYVLDEAGEPQPICVPGELHIGGIGVAQGYLNSPEMTEAKFVRDPFWHDPASRLYKTGDLVRWMPDGSLDFVGRIDNQVKLRGYRLEPGEIESAIATHPAVREASVVVRSQSGGEARLVAFVVAKEAVAKPGAAELRKHVETSLPQHMIPQSFVLIEALPQTPNLKVDRKALAQMAIEEALPTGDVMPRNATEAALQKIWERALGRPSIGVTDNFFELGGHSMLAIRLMAEIEERFGRRLHVNVLFSAPTIEGLAMALREDADTQPWTPVVTLREGGKKPPIWIVHPAGGTTFCYGALAIALGDDQPVHTLQAIGLEPGQEPLGTVEEMASFYLEVIRRQQPTGPLLIAGWSFGGLVSHAMARTLEQAGTPAAFVGLIDTFSPLILPAELRDFDDAQHLVNLFGKDLPLVIEELRALTADGQLSRVVELARAASLVPPDFDIDQAQRLLALYKANAAAVYRYRPEPIATRLHLFRAKTLPPGPARAVAEATPDLGWKTEEGVDVSWLEGDHQSMLRPPEVAALAQEMAGKIAAALVSRPPPQSTATRVSSKPAL